MKNESLYQVLDLMEEIHKVNQMIELHSSLETSGIMMDQYESQKTKLTSFLFKELLDMSDNSTNTMYLIKAIIEKFYDRELANHDLHNEEDLKKIERVFFENYS